MPLKFRISNSKARAYGPVVAMVAVSLIALGAYAQEEETGPIHTLQSGTAAVFTPAKYASGAVADAEYRVFTALGDLAAGDSSKSQLEEENAQLRKELAELEEYRQESERLQELLGYQDAYDLEGVVCTVVSRSGESWNNMLTISKGTNDGVRPGMAVVGPSGVVGQVASANSHTSEVRLLQDPDSGVAVLLQSSRAEGIVKGSLDGKLYLENLPDDAQVEEGDVVITSGLGGSFNRGLIVGTVSKVEGASGGPTRKIVIDPNESVGPLQEVMVITGMGSEGATVEKTGEDTGEDDSNAEAAGEDNAIDSGTGLDVGAAGEGALDVYGEDSSYWMEGQVG
ncbi:MAG: rod shape-determining protein MreC [Eggerthellaceae bacterium]